MGEQQHIAESIYYHQPINQWPEGERPRERLKHLGPSVLTDAELIAILIRTGVKGKTAVDLARNLFVHSKTLREVASMSIDELHQAGIGESRAIAILAAFELARRLPIRDTVEKLTIQSPEDIVRHYAEMFRSLDHEEFWIFPLNAANKLLVPKLITKGILNSSLVHPRESFLEAIQQKAAAVIFVHNHPSGNPEPSQDDLTITQQLVQAGKILGIMVHDHLILAGSTFTSFAERKLI